MGTIFVGIEIIELGIQIEKNGKDFYNTLADNSKNFNAIKAFKYLAEEESKHIDIFQRIYNSLSLDSSSEVYPDEYFAYMNAIASEYVFTQKDKGNEIAKKITNYNDAINMAISFEKDSIVFFEGIKNVVKENEHKIINKLILQEQGHLMKLYEMKNSKGAHGQG
ncbi:ferritin family protein [Candidatus Poribacteria bacterium]|nr:ferritin family protein [Candidatus Poribacteria bacterium]